MNDRYRVEHDSLGEVEVPAAALWGAQTERSRRNFPIGTQRFPPHFIAAFALVKKACALANAELGNLDAASATLIAAACDEVIAGRWDAEFPLSVWQTGSGTQTNMNLNEVIANRANQLAGSAGRALHPNDHVNRAQSSNDVFPSVMHVAAVQRCDARLLPALQTLHRALAGRAAAFAGLLKTGRTHLMDAAPVTLGQEFGAYAAQLEFCIATIAEAREPMLALALGATAVGTGLNAPPGWSASVCAQLARLSGVPFRPAGNLLMAIAAHEALLKFSAALRLLATALLKIANDIRLLASGPRCGLAELRLPANEPGSSIMPGKVNPTQAEALAMVAVQVLGNDAAVAIAGSQGVLELNVYKPLIIHNVLESIELLADACESFALRCVDGIEADPARLAAYVDGSLMLATALNPHIGYEAAARIARHAHEQGLSLRAAALALGLVSAADFDLWVRPADMV
jgi:fumarate hydratase, class II